MGYTIIEYLDASEKGRKRAIGTYDCAYDAVDAIRAALRDQNEGVWGWYLVDDVGTVLFGPTDLAAIIAESDEFEAPRATRNPAGARRPPGVPNTSRGASTNASSSSANGSSGLREPGRSRSATRERHASGLLRDSDLSWD